MTVNRYEQPPGPDLTASFIQLTAQVPHEKAAIEYLESVRWGGPPPHCMKCGTVGGVRRGQTIGRRLDWYCPSCRKRFSVTTGTVLESSKIPLRTWLIAFHLMASSKKGISALQLQRMLDIGQYKSAHFMAQRIRKAIEADPNAPAMKGIIESDEVYIGGRRKGMGRGYRKNKAAVQVIMRRPRWPRSTPRGRHRYGFVGGDSPRSADVRAVTIGSVGPLPVEAAAPYAPPPMSSPVEDIGRVKSVILDPEAEAVDGRTVGAKLRKYTDPAASRLMTDEAPIYAEVGKSFKTHERVHHKKGDYAHVEPMSGRLVSTNQTEGFNANLKRQITGTHHHVSKKHLPRYLTEHDQKYNTRDVPDGDRMLATLQGAEGKRLTLYKSKMPGVESLRDREAPSTEKRKK